MYSIEHDEWIFYSRGNIEKTTRGSNLKSFGFQGKSVLLTIQMKLILLCVWAEGDILGSAKTPLKFKYEIKIGKHI